MSLSVKGEFLLHTDQMRFVRHCREIPSDISSMYGYQVTASVACLMLRSKEACNHTSEIQPFHPGWSGRYQAKWPETAPAPLCTVIPSMATSWRYKCTQNTEVRALSLRILFGLKGESHEDTTIPLIWILIKDLGYQIWSKQKIKIKTVNSRLYSGTN